MQFHHRQLTGSIHMICVLLLLLTLQGSSAADFSKGSSNWSPRKVGTNELHDARTPEEDNLRTAVLGAFSDNRLPKVRDILNQQWNPEAVIALKNVLLAGPERPLSPKPVHWYKQWEAIANLLAYVAAVQTNTPLAEEVRRAFDQFYLYKIKFAEGWVPTVSAVKEYGDASLLTTNFWKGIENGQTAYGLLENVGDQEALRHLKEIKARNVWPKDSIQERFAKGAIEVLESQFKYPELRKIQDLDQRRHFAEEMRRYVDNPEKLRKYAEHTGKEVEAVLKAIADRIDQEKKSQTSRKEILK
jgi:hypothetical protein